MSVHIRPPFYTKRHLGFPTLCERVAILLRAGETLSYEHFYEHVVPNADGCCAKLAARLCDPCVVRAHAIAQSE